MTPRPSDPRYDVVRALDVERDGKLWRLHGHGSSTRVTVACAELVEEVLGLPLCRANAKAIIEAALRSHGDAATAAKEGDR